MWTLMIRRRPTGQGGLPLPHGCTAGQGPHVHASQGDRGPSGHRRAGRGTVVGPQCLKPGTGTPHRALGPERPLGSLGCFPYSGC